jgi:methanogenic corrinoid protein MtbC1
LPDAVTQHYDQVAAELVDAAMAYDHRLLGERLAAATLLGDAVTLHERILAPALYRLGDLWQAGKATVAQEHLLANAVEDTLRDLVRTVQPAEARAVALLACFPDELHGLGLYGVALRLAGLGIRSVMLGPRTPASALKAAVARIEPDWVGLSLTVPLRPENAERTVNELAAATGRTPWAVGGDAAPAVAELVARTGGTVVHPWPDGIRDVLREAVGRRRPRG